MIWFTSDTHFHHKNIVRGTSEWGVDPDRGGAPQRTREFDTIAAHDMALVENINKLVGANDILYHLGDWSFGGFENIAKFREQLNCNTIHFIYGNHDHHIENNKNDIQKIFASVAYYKEKTIENIRVIMCHFAMRVWNKSHHGSVMLYGHSHGTLDGMTPDIANPTWIGDGYFIKNWRTMDVGVDTNNLKPYSWDEIKSEMSARPVLLGVDHHASHTN